MVDEPKPLFRRFRRLGVYDWSDVAGSIRRDGKVLAMRFSGTEVFKRPIPLAELLLLLPEESRANFVAPVVLSEGKFIALYRQAMA